MAQTRGRQLQDLKFRCQHGVGPYIVDFFCTEKRLTVEVDGDVHALEGRSPKCVIGCAGSFAPNGAQDDALNTYSADEQDGRSITCK